jgi:FlaA1/EpsC-like NDP-sugar epimerase
MFQFFTNLSRHSKQAIVVSFDFIAIICILVAAFWIRLGYFFIPTENVQLFFLILFGPFLAIPIFAIFGLYREVIRYLSLKVIWKVIQAASFYAISWGLFTFMIQSSFVPRSVILINWILIILVIVSSRLLARWLLIEGGNSNNVLIYGAGSAGRQLSNALLQSKEYNPIAFLDDYSDIHNQSINGLKVFSLKNLETLIEEKNIKEVLIAIPSLARSRRAEIINFLEAFPVAVRSLPGVTELAQGKVKVNNLLEIDLRELLGREPVKPIKSLFEKNISNKVVMVTGAGGSIGSELCQQILFLKPRKLVLFELSESSLYLIEQLLIDANKSNIEIFPVIGSVNDQQRVTKTCKYFGVQTIYHAAAYKHVPLVESNKSQGILINTLGTLSLAKAAIDTNVETFVLISTDKAVRPANVMGASKRAAELILQSLSELKHNTCFTMVRFGNVLDSSGSVIPLFKKQINEGGPVTVTHAEIIRYFMMIPEAVELVIQAGAMAKGGDVFVLDMGKPILIYDLAVKMINLSGLQLRDDNNPDGDIEIQYTGLRPGEKLYEELLVNGDFYPTDNKLIMRAEDETIRWDRLKPLLDELNKAVVSEEDVSIYNSLKKIVPEFSTCR